MNENQLTNKIPNVYVYWKSKILKIKFKFLIMYKSLARKRH